MTPFQPRITSNIIADSASGAGQEAVDGADGGGRGGEGRRRQEDLIARSVVHVLLATNEILQRHVPIFIALVAAGL